MTATGTAPPGRAEATPAAAVTIAPGGTARRRAGKGRPAMTVMRRHPPQATGSAADPPEDGAGPGIALGGRARAIRFPPFWHAWFARQTESRLAALDELVDAHVERRALRRYLRRLKHATMLAFLGAAAAAHWFSDQIAWLVERLPVLRAFWTLIVGG